MDTLPNGLGGWVWWVFTAIVLSLFVNIVSAYLKEPIDKWWGKFSKRRKIKNEQERKKLDKQVQLMLSSETEVARIELQEMLYQVIVVVVACTAAILAVLFLGNGNLNIIELVWLAGIIYFLGRRVDGLIKIQRILREYGSIKELEEKEKRFDEAEVLYMNGLILSEQVELHNEE